MILNARDTDSRSSPRSRQSTVARLRRAENRPFRSRSAAAPVALRAPAAAADPEQQERVDLRIQEFFDLENAHVEA